MIAHLPRALLALLPAARPAPHLRAPVALLARLPPRTTVDARVAITMPDIGLMLSADPAVIVASIDVITRRPAVGYKHRRH